jgi:hypothetical protein
LHFVVQPRFRHPQVATNRYRGNIKRLGDFIVRQPTEVAKLDRFALAGIKFFEVPETSAADR